MANGGLFEAHRKEDCETHVVQLIEGRVQKLWDRTVAHIKAAMEARSFDPGPREEPDYEKKLREHEGQMDELVDIVHKIARDHEPGFRMGDYHERRGDKKSWKDYILGILALVIVAWLGRLSYQMDDLIKVVANQANDEKRLDRLEQHVYRGAP